MGKKRLVIDLTQAEHDGLVDAARRLGLTVSNYVRKALHIPLRHQGVKHSEQQPKFKPRRIQTRKSVPKAEQSDRELA